jgi:hypothetical protein
MRGEFGYHMKDIAFFERVQSAMRSKDHSIAVDDVERLAEICSDYFAWHRWDNMAEDKADLRLKMRGGDYDVNEPTKSQCREAVSAILTAIGSQSIEGERTGG